MYAPPSNIDGGALLIAAQRQAQRCRGTHHNGRTPRIHTSSRQTQAASGGKAAAARSGTINRTHAILRAQTHTPPSGEPRIRLKLRPAMRKHVYRQG